jgi:6-phosphogluconolactonase
VDPTILRLPDAEEVGAAAAHEFVRCARSALAARGRFSVALAGGSTPRRSYERLGEAPLRGQVDWDGVDFFWSDERAVPPDHRDSNYRMACEALLDRLAIDARRLHRMQGERADLDAAARDYEAELARAFGVAPSDEPPALDLVFLGLGGDGHTASLFPHTAALRETTRWAVANHVPRLGARRLTLTAPILNRAARVVFLVAGAEKADILAEVLEGPADPERLPSQLIRPQSGALVWIVDRLAAARLTRPMSPTPAASVP